MPYLKEPKPLPNTLRLQSKRYDYYRGRVEGDCTLVYITS